MKTDKIRIGSFVLCLSVFSFVKVVQAVPTQAIHGDSIFKNEIISEEDRLEEFVRRHGTYPDPKWVAKEEPSYVRRMEERERSLMLETRHSVQKRWDEWMFLAQARIMPTFTDNQFDVVRAPASCHEKLRRRFHEMLATATVESKGGELSGVEGPVAADFFPQEELNYEVLNELKPLFEEWSGVELETTSVYGVRIYRNGSTLRDHLDVLESHVISGIFHIDSDLDAPFPIQIENKFGSLSSVDLKPGELMFYESAKSYHQRSIPMQGRYYASVFLHYRPVGWSMSREDSRVAVPPYWRDGIVDEEPSPPPKRREDHRQADAPFNVRFVNPTDISVELWWSSDGESARVAELQPGAEINMNTFKSHHIAAHQVVNSHASSQSVPGPLIAEWIMSDRRKTLAVPNLLGESRHVEF